MCLAQGHNTATRVGLEPQTSRSGVRGLNHQATAPPYNADVTHLGHRCALTALMKLGPGSMPRVGPSGQNLEHYLKTHVYIYMYTVVCNYALSFSCIFII